MRGSKVGEEGGLLGRVELRAFGHFLHDLGPTGG